MRSESKSKDQSWIKETWQNNKTRVILVFIAIIYLGIDTFFLGASVNKLLAQYTKSLPINGTEIVLALLLGLVIIFILSLCLDATLKSTRNNRAILWFKENVLPILVFIAAFFLAATSYMTWVRLHQQIPSIIQITSLFLFVTISVVALALAFKDINEKTEESVTWRIIKRAFLPFILLPLISILSLLILDLTAFFMGSTLYKDPDTRSFLFTLYAGAFAFFAFGVTLYVAHIRHTSLKLAEKQFIYTQTQKHEEEIEKRFQEGIKLLGNEQESIRLGGIFVLWEIAKDAVKALPYLENECVYYAEYTNDKEQTYILPYRLEEADNDLDTANQTELKKCYLKDHPSSKVQIGAYLKAFSLHEQILNILCAYIRTKTNHENYIKENYPSIFQKRYSHRFKEAFGKKGEFNHIKESEEKPSHEIQNLLDLLLKMPLKEKRQGVVLNKHYIPSHALGFKLNFNHAILKKADCKEACFEKASCDAVNFQYLICESASFKQTSLYKTDFQNTCSFGTSFEQAVCYMTIFQNTEFSQANFQNAKCDNTNFQESKLTLANFKQAKFDSASFQYANCTQAEFHNAKLDQTDFQHADCSYANFQDTTGTTPNFQHSNLLEANFASSTLLHAKFKNAESFDITKWPHLKQT